MLSGPYAGPYPSVSGLHNPFLICQISKIRIGNTMDYLRMDRKQYASKVRNEALNDFDWLSQWLE